MKELRIVLMIRLLAVIDVLFSEKFELIVYKNGVQKSRTSLDKKK
jgi:hypothetical protein